MFCNKKKMIIGCDVIDILFDLFCLFLVIDDIKFVIFFIVELVLSCFEIFV